MDSELQNAIQRVESRHAKYPWVYHNDDFKVWEAARKVANPDIDTMRRTIISAGIELQNQERNITWPEWAVELLVALGVTEAPDGQ